jgi:hypothetical protein
VTDRRTPPRFVRRGLLAAAAACALGGSATADPVPSREYPPTYSSRKAPWYDPFRLFTSNEQKPATPAPKTGSLPIPTAAVEVPVGGAATPAWKWYGYGTPTPGGNPLAPNGMYPGVPGNWYTSSGTTPGAIPLARIGFAPITQPDFPAIPGVVPDPAPSPSHRTILPPPTRIDGTPDVAVPPDPPALPGVVTPPPVIPPSEVNWTATPARLAPPTPDTVTTTDGPGATLKAPVRPDEAPAPPGRPTVPVASPPKTVESPDIPVEPAPGIIMPLSHRNPTGPITARGHAPETDLSDSVRQACGSGARVMEVVSIGPKQMVVRLAGRAEDIRAARGRLARLPELAGWRVDLELVTPLAK